MNILFYNQTKLAVADIIYHNVHYQVFILDLFINLEGCIRLKKVFGNGNNFHAMLLRKLLFALLQVFLCAGYKNEVIAIAGEMFSQFVSNSLRTAGDYCIPVVCCTCHVLFLSLNNCCITIRVSAPLSRSCLFSF